MMKPIALALALATSLQPAVAQTDQDGRTLMERGAELFMEGLRQEMSPAMDNLRQLADEFGPEMRSFLAEMGPALASLMDEVQDWTRYYPPEMLPNGDIIMRRKPDPDPAPETPQEHLPPAGPTDI